MNDENEIEEKFADYFAVNRHVPTLHAELMQTIAEVNAQHAYLQWHVLLDTVFDATFMQQFSTQFSEVKIVNLYKNTPLEELHDVAPVLITLPYEQTAQQNILHFLLEAANGKPILSIVASEHAAQTIKESWQSFLRVQTEDQQILGMRFADTRTLSDLIAILDEQQYAAMMQTVTHWWIIHRLGNGQNLYPAGRKMIRKIVSVNDKEFLHLSKQQFAALIDSADADTLAGSFVKMVPQIFKHIPGGELHQRLTEQLRHMRQFCITNVMDQFDYCVAAVSVNWELHYIKEARALLEQKKWQSGNLGEALLALPVLQK